MDIGLYNVNVAPPGMPYSVLTSSANGLSTGKILKPAPNVDVTYSTSTSVPPAPPWHAAWTAPQGYRIATSLSGQTVRMIVRPTTSGNIVRVKIENTVGQSQVVFNDAYIGQVSLPSSPPGVLTSPAVVKNVQLYFNGKTQLTLDPGAGAYSDPLPFPITAFTLYAVSLDVSSASDISSHLLGLATNYVGTNTHASETTGALFKAVPSAPDPKKGDTYPVYWVSALDVFSPSSNGTVVALGDSITDGQCSTYVPPVPPAMPPPENSPDLYKRWTDLLAEQFFNMPGYKALVNEGIAGNLIAGGTADAVGAPALYRIAGDVLEREGATHVILFEGTNDIGNSSATTPTEIDREEARLEAAYLRLIGDAHTIGLNIIGATLIPRGGQKITAWTTAMETMRTDINKWIPTAPFDGYIDFDSAMQGGGTRSDGAVILPAQWSCHDNVHPNMAGYRQLTNAILAKSYLFNTGLRAR
jgi:lysophospholipase L1-like esterase